MLNDFNCSVFMEGFGEYLLDGKAGCGISFRDGGLDNNFNDNGNDSRSAGYRKGERFFAPTAKP